MMITGCTGMCGVKRASMTPSQVVEAYLDVALNMNDVGDRDVLAEFTTGNLKAAIESASPETIRTAYVDRKYQIVSYSVVEQRDRTPRETEITFQLTYHDLGVNAKDAPKDAADNAPKVTTENTVSVIKKNGLWFIRDVLGNKTAIDFPVSADSQISAKPGPGIDQPEDTSEPEEPAPPTGPDEPMDGGESGGSAPG
jgi:hypothetical protein